MKLSFHSNFRYCILVVILCFFKIDTSAQNQANDASQSQVFRTDLTEILDADIKNYEGTFIDKTTIPGYRLYKSKKNVSLFTNTFYASNSPDLTNLNVAMLFSSTETPSSALVNELDKIIASGLPGFKNEKEELMKGYGKAKDFKRGVELHNKKHTVKVIFAENLNGSINLTIINVILVSTIKYHNNQTHIYGFKDMPLYNWVIDPKYDVSESFSDGLARVIENPKPGKEYPVDSIKGGKWGFIDRNGDEVIPLKYEYASAFKDGYAQVKLKGKVFWIDKKGKIADKPNPVIITNTSASAIASSFTDARDGKKYKIVKIGNQVWMAENLAFKTAAGSWAYDNNESNVATHGYLYDWATAAKACPPGWHLPTDAEWTTLIETLGGEDASGIKLKAASSWVNSGVNESGFTGMPSGEFSENKFSSLGIRCFWWSATEYSPTLAWSRNMFSNASYVTRLIPKKTSGLSVRCIKDL